MEVRSNSFWPGNASVISENIGPEKLFSATVVRMEETPKPAAAWLIRAALVRRLTASIDLVANDICDWKSIRISVWSWGEISFDPGTGLAFGAMVYPSSAVVA